MQELTHSDSAFINFRDHVFNESGGHGYRWIDIKRFRLPADAPGDPAVIAALIAHAQFRDDYAGGGVEPDGTRHGPYWTQNVTVDAYRAISRNGAAGTLQSWASQHGPLPSSLEDVLAREVYPAVRPATSCYELSNLGPEAFHDWGGVHIDFHEFVVIDRRDSSLTLIVAADD
ncbi:hypothetical protein [Streptomyces sp. NBC_01244]|uniref:hypothetical protein n=1 Tax=Streptomyces sp. NBC_01244 TaxID=2903797 RepID=UPI002E1445B5|nr:hypothetical protein OG247_41355 [Streptomyces sp. NBC_01244]